METKSRYIVTAERQADLTARVAELEMTLAALLDALAQDPQCCTGYTLKCIQDALGAHGAKWVEWVEHYTIPLYAAIDAAEARIAELEAALREIRDADGHGPKAMQEMARAALAKEQA